MKIDKQNWFNEYKEIVDKYHRDTGYLMPISDWDCYEQYYIDGYTPRQAFDEDINTDF